MAKHNGFSPVAMCSDTWLHKQDCWGALFSNTEGGLGSFHFKMRSIQKLRKKHVDFVEAVMDLLGSVSLASAVH